jgi:hypothetical protein
LGRSRLKKNVYICLKKVVEMVIGNEKKKRKKEKLFETMTKENQLLGESVKEKIVNKRNHHI